ncbi:hypothetical protein QCA50_014342 [Cerrena zonata]|uniref:Nitrogen regulatory protein areA GATA-like domain-containing protein n=1 Tax=Cerrena zonata TaxID=2478898 RepID=A0AAW0FZ22_9APHY
MISFAAPILCVAPDVVQELDGEDAIYSLWNVFTKCKASLSDGRRLENLSWRLWYREILSHGASSYSSGSTSPSDTDFRSQSPITPVSETGTTHSRAGDVSTESLLTVDNVPTARSWHGENLAPTATNVSRRLSTASMPVRPVTKSSSQRAGQLIIDILPDKVVVPPRRDTSIPTKLKLGTNAPNPTVVKATLIPLAQPRPRLPAVQLPPGTPPSVGDGSSLFPRVVVVHPTPHPTPPATPQASHSVTAVPAGPAPTHLLPPPARRPVFSNQTPEESASTAVPSTAPISRSESSCSSDSDRPKPKEDFEATIKPSDRRFFLRQTGSPDALSAGSRSPEAVCDTKDNDPEPSPSSGTSSHITTSGNIKRAGGAQTRRGKQVRPTTTRTASRVHVQRAQAAQRRVNDAKRATTFNIGSNSSTGSKHNTGSSTAPKSHATQPDQDVSNPPPTTTTPKNGDAQTAGRAGGSHPTVTASPEAPIQAAVEPTLQPTVAPANGRGPVMSTSSEYETTDTDDDSEWASDNDSPDEQELAKQKEEIRLREAAEEAQRQRDMFAKVPKRSYSNLNRTRSGLLSQLLNPDPNIFPPNHPYRSTSSSQDMTQLGRTARLPASGLSMSKSTVAVPLATAMTAQAPPGGNGLPQGNGSGGYRPKGRPADAEMEDDSEDENPENTIQVSQSVAQQKLAQLADPNRRRNSARGPPQPAPVVQARPQLTTVQTAPIPFGHPYNLPAPAPPTSPRTTRRQMLSTELSESLRRNLLWERQVSKINMTGGARRGGLLGGGVRPLTTVGAAGPSGNQPLNPAEERRKTIVARNRSWADDYHFSGW